MRCTVTTNNTRLSITSPQPELSLSHPTVGLRQEIFWCFLPNPLPALNSPLQFRFQKFTGSPFIWWLVVPGKFPWKWNLPALQDCSQETICCQKFKKRIREMENSEPQIPELDKQIRKKGKGLFRAMNFKKKQIPCKANQERPPLLPAEKKSIPGCD